MGLAYGCRRNGFRGPGRFIAAFTIAMIRGSPRDETRGQSDEQQREDANPPDPALHL
jgi:hypothetical protein